MLNELERPSLKVSLDVEIPDIPELKHDLRKVEEFSIELSKFYNNLLDLNQLGVKEIKAERTKVRKLMKTIGDNRKAAVKAFKTPIQDFEDTSKRIEKVLKETDDRMKSIVDAEKEEEVDPFAGLTTNVSCETYNFSITCTKEQYEELLEIMKMKGIIINGNN